MISEGFVSNGAKVYISSRDGSACDKAASEMNEIAAASASGGSAVSLPADLSSLAEVKRVSATLSAEESSLHVLVNNSGATWGESFDTHPDSAWTKLLTLNLQRVFSLTQALTPLLEKAGSAMDPARVIHIGSIDALRVPVLPNFAYSASKAGLHHLSRALATELGPRGITSNTVACGPFPSKMMRKTLEDLGDEIKAANPLGRIGMPQDVAGTCLFLSSRAG
jgi:NAD(P)-dependent dehydrogenase (short-subunit alcohol dehydrogenase family)